MLWVVSASLNGFDLPKTTKAKIRPSEFPRRLVQVHPRRQASIPVRKAAPRHLLDRYNQHSTALR